MFRCNLRWVAWRYLVIGLLALLASTASAADLFPGIGRPATRAEIQAWDIDVRPDFVGLPPGSGSVARGQQVWEARCESCHGVFGESTEVFSPIVGGTTPQDSVSGRVANLRREDYPQRTTLMKVPTLSTLWDYINRAMPWNAPKSLTTDEVYAVTAYILHLGDIVPSDFVLTDRTIRDVQANMPNRNGMVFYRPLWDIRGKGDTRNSACMKNCVAAVTVTSTIPDYARNAHGNLADQHRLIGQTRGVVTAAAASTVGARDAAVVAGQQGCLGCHAIEQRVIGPSYKEIAARYRPVADAETQLIAKIRQGGAGNWGGVAMPPQAAASEDDLRLLVRWILMIDP
ncbi:MAG: c-type cytochrome [Betaproteobacteria bacterium]|nr:c-type cytochrome [Betaproteobacteria bacterium]